MPAESLLFLGADWSPGNRVGGIMALLFVTDWFVAVFFISSFKESLHFDWLK